jgi:hypothetical protein
MKKLLLPLIFIVITLGCGQPARQTETPANASTVSVNSNAQSVSNAPANIRTSAGNVDIQRVSNSNKKQRDVSYLPSIEISGAKFGKTVEGEDGIVGEVKNIGNKTVKILTIRAAFLDKAGNKVSESDFPIVFADAADAESRQPLKPNDSRKFGFKVYDPADLSREFKLYVMEANTEN